jgi:hypothetical protein
MGGMKSAGVAGRSPGFGSLETGHGIQLRRNSRHPAGCSEADLDDPRKPNAPALWRTEL